MIEQNEMENKVAESKINHLIDDIRQEEAQRTIENDTKRNTIDDTNYNMSMEDPDMNRSLHPDMKSDLL